MSPGLWLKPLKIGHNVRRIAKKKCSFGKKYCLVSHFVFRNWAKQDSTVLFEIKFFAKSKTQIENSQNLVNFKGHR